MAVNISPHQVMSETFLPQVTSLLLEGPFRPELITLEITESVFLRDSEHAIAALSALRDLGVQLALDDFGTGYSSLSYLKRFPVDCIKIDRSFITDLGRDRASNAVVESIVELAHKLDLVVVAEGVQTQTQSDAVAAAGCDFSQGFFFARPMPALDVVDLLRGRGG